MTEPSVHSSSFWKPTRRHRFDSAIVVLIALNVFPRFGQKERQEVEQELREVFKKTAATRYTAWREIVGRSSDHVAVLRGIAMARLRISTGVEGLDWSSFVQGSWLRNPLRSLYAFQRFDPATDEAADFLRSRGFVLDEPSDHGLRWMNEMRARYP